MGGGGLYHVVVGASFFSQMVVLDTGLTGPLHSSVALQSFSKICALPLVSVHYSVKTNQLKIKTCFQAVICTDHRALTSFQSFSWVFRSANDDLMCHRCASY